MMVVLPEHVESSDGNSDRASGPTPAQELASAIAKTVFRLNGQLVEMAEDLAAPAGLSASWWRVLGSVVEQPASVSDIARRFGITRQSVQRVADMLVGDGLAEYRTNPAHRRAKLLCPTESGRDRLRRIAPGHRVMSARLVDELGPDRLQAILDELQALAAGFDAATPPTTAGDNHAMPEGRG